MKYIKAVQALREREREKNTIKITLKNKGKD
jgi:hypothetical protein